MKTIEDIRDLMVGKSVIKDLADLLRANDAEFAESEKKYLAAVDILRAELIISGQIHVMVTILLDAVYLILAFQIIYLSDSGYIMVIICIPIFTIFLVKMIRKLKTSW